MDIAAMNYFTLIWRSVWYRPGRTILTVLSTAAAFLLLGILQGAGYTLSHPSPGFGSDTLAVTSKASYGLPLPYAYLREIQSVPGVDLAVTGDHINGHYRDPKNPVRANAIDPPGAYFALMHDEVSLSDADLKRFKETRTGAVVGPAIARRFGWKVGDLITLHANGNYVQRNGSVDWTFTVVGIEQVKDPREMHQFGDDIRFQYAYLDEARALGKGNVALFLVKPQPTVTDGQIAKAIDARFANSASETRTVPLKELVLILVKQFGDVGFIVSSITAAVLFTLVLMLGNVMMHNIYERTPLFAVLKAIGFSNRRVALLVAAESAMTCLLGASVGVAAACLLMPMMKQVVDITGVSYSPLTLLPGVAVALALAVGIGLIPAWRAQRLQIVAALAVHH
jgi:putative ABC transport system permease protein